MDSEWRFRVKWENKAYEVREAYTTYHYPSFLVSSFSFRYERK